MTLTKIYHVCLHDAPIAVTEENFNQIFAGMKNKNDTSKNLNFGTSSSCQEKNKKICI